MTVGDISAHKEHNTIEREDVNVDDNTTASTKNVVVVFTIFTHAVYFATDVPNVFLEILTEMDTHLVNVSTPIPAN